MKDALLKEKLESILKSEKEKLSTLINTEYETRVKLDDLNFKIKEVENNLQSTQILLRALELNAI